MVGALSAIVSSTWYSEFFNQGVKEQLVSSYKALRSSGMASNSALQKNFDRLSKMPGMSSSLIEMHSDEELALASLKDNRNSDQRLSVLRNWLLKAQTEETEAIVLEKIIRCELVAAKVALNAGDWQKAEKLSQEALDDLKQQKGQYEFSPPRRYVTAILDVSAEAKRLAGDNANAKRIEHLAERLKDPDYAKGWYKRNQLAGYSAGYPPQYAVRFILGNAPADADKSDTILKAIAVCGRSDMTQSPLRLTILREALEFNPSREKKTQIEDAVLDVWTKYCTQIPVTVPDQGPIVGFLQVPAMRKRSPETMQLINKKIEEAIRLDVISHAYAQQFMRSLIYSELLCNIFAMDNHSPAKAAAAAERLEDLVALCKKKHLDDTWVKIYWSVVLAQAGKRDESEQILRELINTQKPDHNQLQKQELIAQAFLVFENRVPHFNATEAAKACSLLETALKCGDWAESPKTALLLALSHQKIAAGQPAEGQKYREQAWKLLEKKDDFGSVSAALDHVVFLMYKPDVEAAAALFNRLQKKIRQESDNSVQLYLSLLTYCRSYPAASDQLLRSAQANRFPDAEFRKALKMAQERRGQKPERYIGALLWMAEYELCRCNYEESAKYCNEVLDCGPPTKNTQYWAANDILMELGKKTRTTIPQKGEIVGFTNSREELHCLYSTYVQLKRLKAANRAKALVNRVKEID